MRYVMIFIITLFFIPTVSAQSYRGYSCDELWEARNEIYKNAGYCFKTNKAVRRFGNAGCLYDDMRDVPLTHNQRRTVNAIQKQERVYRCPR